MATAQRLIGNSQALRIVENGKKRRSRRTVGRGKIYLDIDVSAFQAKLKGLDSKFFCRSKEVKNIMISGAIKVKRNTRNAVIALWKKDPRHSVKAIHLTYDTKLGYPAVSITASSHTRQEADWPKYKQGTNRFKKYQGADRGMLVYWWNAGVVKNHESAKNIYTRTARSGMAGLKDEILRNINNRVIDPMLGGHVAQHNT